MDIDVITQLISNLGFPIVCCIALCWMMMEDRKQHREESANFVEAINKLTIMIEKLNDKLGE